MSELFAAPTRGLRFPHMFPLVDHTQCYEKGQ
jgi:hypothetical protein